MKFEKIKEELSDYGRFEERDRSRPYVFVDDILHFAFWHAYLMLSPSYALAERLCRKQPVDQSTLPDDIDEVVRTYETLGNVRDTVFSQWWNDTGLKVFGYLCEEPSVTRIKHTRPGEESIPDFGKYLSNYLNEDWDFTGRQPTMIVAVPLALPQKTVFKQLKDLINRVPKADRRASFPEPRFKLVVERFDKVSLQKYHWAVLCKAHLHRPGEKLPANWKVEHVARVYSGSSDAQQIVLPNNLGKDERNVNAEKARLDLERANLIAENAARGSFPSQKKNSHALPFDFDDLHNALTI